MTPEEKFKLINNNYVDLFVKYIGDPVALNKYKDYSVHIMNTGDAVIYLPASQITSQTIMQFSYSSIPKLYSLNSQQSLQASGINKIREVPNVGLRGEGVIVGLIDTGIDYTNPVFRRKDGSTKILAIWDQSIDSENQYPITISPAFLGTEYTQEQINQALNSDNPYEVVPSRDEVGHGTMLAGIAAGSEDFWNNFSGVVPDADLLVVKLKPAKEVYKNFFLIPPDVPCYQENDLTWALEYLIDTARKFRRPIAICIGLGTSQGAHDNSGVLSPVVSVGSDFPGVATAIAAGNEGNARRHFYSTLNPAAEPISVEINVGENESGFTMELWGEPPIIYNLDILSPSGEYVQRFAENLEGNREVSLLFENTTISIDYFMVEEDTGKQVILLRFRNPTQGIWKLQVYGRGDLMGAFHIWLPSDGFISTNTYFLASTPFTTVTSPGNGDVPITVTAYNPDSDTLYTDAGKGYSAANLVKPELAAPGVNLLCPALDHSFTEITGTGAAAAHMTGIAAMVLEWSIVRGNMPGIDTNGVKRFLIRGARRSNLQQYPNRYLGYGYVDIYNSFNLLRIDIKT